MRSQVRILRSNALVRDVEDGATTATLILAKEDGYAAIFIDGVEVLCIGHRLRQAAMIFFSGPLCLQSKDTCIIKEPDVVHDRQGHGPPRRNGGRCGRCDRSEDDIGLLKKRGGYVTPVT